MLSRYIATRIAPAPATAPMSTLPLSMPSEIALVTSARYCGASRRQADATSEKAIPAIMCHLYSPM